MRGHGADFGDVGCEKVVREGVTGPGVSVGSDGYIRRGGGDGRDGGGKRRE